MSTALVISLVAIACALVAIAVSRRRGPHVTTIETRRDDRDGQGE